MKLSAADVRALAAAHPDAGFAGINPGPIAAAAKPPRLPDPTPAQRHARRFSVLIGRWHPTPLNQLLGSHHMVAARLKASDAAIVFGELFAAGVPAARAKRRVSLILTLGKGQRACDPDAYFKSAHDALVGCGALVDDSRQWVELIPVEFIRGDEKATRIILEDIGDAGAQSQGRPVGGSDASLR